MSDLAAAAMAPLHARIAELELERDEWRGLCQLRTEQRDRVREALRLALLWLPNAADWPRMSAEARQQIEAIRAADQPPVQETPR